MIFRLSQKLNTKVKAGKLVDAPLSENRYDDWSCNLFTVGRLQYILLSNTASLYSCVMPGQGISSAGGFTKTAFEAIGELMQRDGEGDIFERHIAPAAKNVTFAKSLNRSVVSSMNQLVFAAQGAIEGGESLPAVDAFLNDFLLSAIRIEEGSDYGRPKLAFQMLASGLAPIEINRPKSNVKSAGEKSSNPYNQIPAESKIYQFEISLCQSLPKIWRQIQVKSCSLDTLHEHIQIVMGWGNEHPYEFAVQGQSYGDLRYMDSYRCLDSEETKLDDILPQDGRQLRITYLYDFGDDWQHHVLFQRCLAEEPGRRYPLCLAGEGACPPEDIGGIYRFNDFLEQFAQSPLGDPAEDEDEEEDDFLEWARSTASQPFDPVEATERLQKRILAQ